MINQSIIRTFMLCALIAPSVSVAMQVQGANEIQEATPVYPLKQGNFAKYAPFAAGLGVIGWQLLSGGPLSCIQESLSDYYTIPLFQYSKEHPFQTIAALGVVTGSAYLLQQLRNKNNERAPLDRINKKGYLIPCALTAGAGALLTLSQPLNPLIVASVCAVGTAGCIAEIIDNIKDDVEVDHVNATHQAENTILRATGAQKYKIKSSSKNNVDLNAAKAEFFNLVKAIDPSVRKSWIGENTMELYDNLKNPTARPLVMTLNLNS